MGIKRDRKTKEGKQEGRKETKKEQWVSDNNASVPLLLAAHRARKEIRSHQAGKKNMYSPIVPITAFTRQPAKIETTHCPGLKKKTNRKKKGGKGTLPQK